MANNTTLRQKRGIVSAIYSFLFGPYKSQDVKQMKKNVTILIDNQNLQQSFIEINAQANNITLIPLAKNRHMINGLVNALKSINNTTYNDNLAVNSLNHTKKISF